MEKYFMRQTMDSKLSAYLSRNNQGVIMSNNPIHVVPNKNNGWSVKREGALRSSFNTSTKSEAIQIATTLAKNSSTELFIHKTNGQIQERNSYGHNPFPPHG